MRKLGFTLAEVLITLVIIGVIAAMTVPTLMNNTNAQEFRSAFKKAISGVNQALTLHYALEGMSANDYEDADALVDNVFKTRMSIIENSTESVTGKSGSSWTTADGMVYTLLNFSNGGDERYSSQDVACNSYNTQPCTAAAGPNLWIDVNGPKNPNRETVSSNAPKDIYQAHVYAQKVIPYGEAAQQVMFDKKVEEAT